MRTLVKFVAFVLLLKVSFWPSAHAQISVIDYRNRLVQLDKPAQKIIALAPHIVENLFAAGAGDLIVGAVDHCDYPAQAKKIPRVGAISSFSLEIIIKLKPDLIVLWGSTRSENMLAQLEKLDFNIYVSDPRQLEDVPKSIRHFGVLTGNQKLAEKSAREFENRYQRLKRKFAQSPAVSAFYQVWDDPIRTLNDNHIISDVIRLCGGANAFGDALVLAPIISIESVISRNPDVIIASGMGEERPDWLDGWKKWKNLEAVKNDDLYFIPPDIIQRHTPRILDGTSMMCNHLEATRKKKSFSN